MLTGRQLIEDIRTCEVPRGRLAFWWLGQMGFAVKGGDQVVLLDAYLKPREDRLVPPLVRVDEIDLDVALICGTHDHSDHIDRYAWPLLARQLPEARFVAPDLLLHKVAGELGIAEGRFIGSDHLRSFEHRGIRVTGVASAHEFLDRDPGTGRYPHVGLVLEMNGCTLYHAGDTCKWEGMETALKQWRFDVVFLPINGRDARRYAMNLIGNMTYQEAADLAGALEPRLTVPGHYEMFAKNLGDVTGFTDYMHVKYPHLKTWAGPHGEQTLI